MIEIARSLTDPMVEVAKSLRKWKLALGKWKFAVGWLYRQERASPVPVPLGLKLRMWRRGFLGESARIYEQHLDQLSDYLSDFVRVLRTQYINGPNAIYLNNKILFEASFSAAFNVPRNLGILVQGRFLPIRQRGGPPDIASLLEHARSQGALVFKRIGGGGGAGIYILRHHPEHGFTWNERAVAQDELHALVRALDYYLACDYVRQADYARAIFPRTTNTIRVLTMIDPDSGEAFIARAVHRFGNMNSVPVDNWTQGGLSARIDLESGELGPGVTYPRNGSLVFHDTHPDTGAAIRGVRVPRWSAITSELLAVARAWSFLPYVGWDVVVTDDGFFVIEGNNFTDVNLMQVHGPLLSDPRVRRFYRHHKAIR